MGNKFSNLQKLINHGKKRDISEYMERSKIHLTSKLDNCGADCDGHIQEPISCLHYLVAFLEETDFCILLWKQKEDVCMYININTARTLKTPLMYAVLHNNYKLIKLLLECKCDINITDKSGNTALHYASEKGYVQCVHAILESGLADVNIKNTEFKRTALEHAVYFRRTGVIEILSNYTRKMNSCSHITSFTDDSGIHRESSRISILSDVPNENVATETIADVNYDESPKASYDIQQDHGLLCEKYTKQLKKTHEKIVLYLDVSNVLDKMYAKEFFNREKFLQIRNETCSKQVHLIIDILHAKSNRKFEEFLEILRQRGQEALAHTIETTSVELDNSNPYNQEVGQTSAECGMPSKSKANRDQYRSCFNLSNNFSTTQSYIPLANEADDWNM